MSKQLPEIVLTYLREFGRRGGVARRINLTPEERSRIARHAVSVRWAKKKSAA